MQLGMAISEHGTDETDYTSSASVKGVLAEMWQAAREVLRATDPQHGDGRRLAIAAASARTIIHDAQLGLKACISETGEMPLLHDVDEELDVLVGAFRDAVSEASSPNPPVANDRSTLWITAMDAAEKFANIIHRRTIEARLAHLTPN